MIDKYEILIKKYNDVLENTNASTINDLYQYFLDNFDNTKFNKLIITMMTKNIVNETEIKDYLDDDIYCNILMMVGFDSFSDYRINIDLIQRIKTVLKYYNPKDLIKLKMELQ
jgi:hypothetical protein